MDALLAECGSGNDPARNLDSPPTDFTICAATFTDQMYRDRLGYDSRFDIIEGDLAADRPGFPVVLAWDADCASTQLLTSFEVELVPLESLDGINRAREVEVELKAAALRSCLGLEQARALARSARAELGESWLLLDFEPDVPGGCYAVVLDLKWGTISASGRDDGTPVDPAETETTEVPTGAGGTNLAGGSGSVVLR